MDLDRLQELLSARGEPGFRAGQVWALAGARRGVLRRDDRPAGGLRARLAERGAVLDADLEHEAHARDGTVKALFRTRATGGRSRRC